MRAAVEEERILGLVLPTGAATLADLRLTTPGRRALAALVREGTLRRTGRVVHLDGALPSIIAARRLGGLLTCASALAVYDLPELLPSAQPHVAVPANRGRARLAGTVVHRENGLTATGIAVPPDRLLARLLRCAPEKESIAITDQALHRRLVTREDLLARLTGRGNGCPGARRRLARCTDRARSPIESLARVELEDAGHRAAPGIIVPDVGEVDLLVDERLVVETDGYAFHSSRLAWANDRRRDQILLGRGLPVIRLTFDDVMSGRTVRLVEGALAGAPTGVAPREERSVAREDDLGIAAGQGGNPIR